MYLSRCVFVCVFVLVCVCVFISTSEHSARVCSFSPCALAHTQAIPLTGVLSPQNSKQQDSVLIALRSEQQTPCPLKNVKAGGRADVPLRSAPSGNLCLQKRANSRASPSKDSLLSLPLSPANRAIHGNARTSKYC